MSEPPSPRNTLTIQHKHHRNASFSVRSENINEEADKSARKFFTTWRTACDKTKDKTRELLKRTLSWKGHDYSVPELTTSQEDNKPRMANSNQQGGWSVHIWSKFHANS